MPDYFTFAVRRRREVAPDWPEPTVSFHLTAEVGGEVFDEAIIDVGFGEAGGWQRETVTSHLMILLESSRSAFLCCLLRFRWQ